MFRTRWRSGAAHDAEAPFVVSATRFVYRRRRYLPLVSYHAWRLRRGWGSRQGAVGLLTGAETLRPVTYSVSVWAREEDLQRFLRAPEHVRLMHDFRARLVESKSVTWSVDRVVPEDAWREALRRLNDLLEGRTSGTLRSPGAGALEP